MLLTVARFSRIFLETKEVLSGELMPICRLAGEDRVFESDPAFGDDVEWSKRLDERWQVW